MTPFMVDVVIIGAGPAGTAAGYRLARAGYRVLILDRQRFPRKKACAGGITPKAMALFPYDISHLVLRTCHRVKITRPGGDAFLVKDKEPLCYMVQRKDLDRFSLAKAVAAGAEFRVAERILSLDQTVSGARLKILENGEEKGVRTRFVIGADGANSRIRRLIESPGFDEVGRPDRMEKYPALEADVRVTSARDYPMEFDFSRGIRGYYWIFPKDDHVNIGVYAADPRATLHRGLLEAYALDRLGHTGLEAVKGYPIGVGGSRIGTMAAGKGTVLLAGDAAGFAEPLLGEGIYAALKSGQLAADAIGRALEVGSSQALSLYQASLTRLRLDLWLYHRTAGILYRSPKACLCLASHAPVLYPFRRGYAAGRTLSRILLPF